MTHLRLIMLEEFSREEVARLINARLRTQRRSCICRRCSSVETGAGKRIGDLPVVAKVARESTAKINCPTSRRRIENRFGRNPHSSGR